MVGSDRAIRMSGGLFVAAFTAGLVLLGDELGAFADSDDAFVDHFSSAWNRGGDIAGSVLLVVAAAAFMYFTHLVATLGPAPLSEAVTSSLIRVAGFVAGLFMVVAALALVTVPASVSLGEFFDETGGAFGQGQAVLPQFGFVALVFGAMIPASVTIVAITRLKILPVWHGRASIAGAVVLGLWSASVIAMVLLPIWVALTTVVIGRGTNTTDNVP